MQANPAGTSKKVTIMPAKLAPSHTQQNRVRGKPGAAPCWRQAGRLCAPGVHVGVGVPASVALGAAH